MKNNNDIIEEAIQLYLAGGYIEDSLNLSNPPITTYMFYKELECRGYDKRGRISRRSVVSEDTLLVCSNCEKEMPAKYFSESMNCKTGYDVSRCKACKRSKMDWNKVSYEKRIFNRIKSRAKRKNIDFDLDLEDIILPEKCPVFNRPFVYGDHAWTYSLDRIDSTKGYIKGNIQIISNKANMMKSNATLQEIESLYQWMKDSQM